MAFFEANVPIRLTGVNGEVLDIVLDNTTNSQTFVESVSFAIKSIEIDPDYHLISKNNNTVLGLENHFLNSDKISSYPNPTSSILNINIFLN